MFWTAFVWGLGVTAGGSIGLMGFIVLYAGWEWLTGIAAKKAELLGFNAQSLQALRDRNLKTDEMLEHFAVMATCLTQMADNKERERP